MAQGFYPSVALIENYVGLEEMSDCTGTFISHRHVVTAAHCLSPNGQGMVVVSLDKNGQRDQIVSVSRIYNGQDAETQRLGKLGIWGRLKATRYATDLAVLELRHPIENVVPAKLMDKLDRLKNNPHGYLIGMGFSQAVLEGGSQSPFLAEPTLVGDSTDNPYEMWIEVPADQLICSGDSGAGLLIPTAADPQIFALAIRVPQADKTFNTSGIKKICGHRVLASYIQNFRPWLDQFISD
jgi:hypothetical protein